MKKILALLIVITLTSCASTQALQAQKAQQEAKDREVGQAVAAIQKLENDGRISHADAARLTYKKIADTYGADMYIDAYWKYVIYIQSEVDKGKISKEQAEAEMATKRAQFMQAEMAPLQAQMNAYNAANAAIFANMIQHQQPIYNPPKMINCTSYQSGSYVNTNCH